MCLWYFIHITVHWTQDSGEGSILVWYVMALRINVKCTVTVCETEGLTWTASMHACIICSVPYGVHTDHSALYIIATLHGPLPRLHT